MGENKNKASGISVEVQVDTTQLDKAIEKVQQLVSLFEQLDALMTRSNEIVDKYFLEGSGNGIQVGFLAKSQTPPP